MSHYEIQDCISHNIDLIKQNYQLMVQTFNLCDENVLRQSHVATKELAKYKMVKETASRYIRSFQQIGWTDPLMPSLPIHRKFLQKKFHGTYEEIQKYKRELMKVNKGHKGFIYDGPNTNPLLVIDPNFYNSTETESSKGKGNKRYFKS